MKWLQTCLSAVLALALWACGTSDSESDLDHYAAELSDSASAMHMAMATHHDEVLRQTDLEQIADLETVHMASMKAQFGGMQDALDSMTTCSGQWSQSEPPHHAVESLREAGVSMHGLMQEGMLEMQRHAQAMGAASDIDVALGEESHHRAAMAGMMEELSMDDADIADAMRAMRDAGMSTRCPAMTHMHRR